MKVLRRSLEIPGDRSSGSRGADTVCIPSFVGVQSRRLGSAFSNSKGKEALSNSGSSLAPSNFACALSSSKPSVSARGRLFGLVVEACRGGFDRIKCCDRVWGSGAFKAALPRAAVSVVASLIGFKPIGMNLLVPGDRRGMFSAPTLVERKARGVLEAPEKLSLVFSTGLNRRVPPMPFLRMEDGEGKGEEDSAGVGEHAKSRGGEEEMSTTADMVGRPRTAHCCKVESANVIHGWCRFIMLTAVAREKKRLMR